MGMLKEISVERVSCIHSIGKILTFRSIRNYQYFTCLWRRQNTHNMITITMTSQWAGWRLKSPASRLFTQPFIRAQIKKKHQSPASLAFVRGIHRRPVNSPHKWPVTRKLCQFDDVIMYCNYHQDETTFWRKEFNLWRLVAHTTCGIELCDHWFARCLHQRWITGNWDPENWLPWNLSQNTKLFIQENTFRNDKLPKWRPYFSFSICWGVSTFMHHLFYCDMCLL